MRPVSRLRVAFWVVLGILLAAGLGGFSAMEISQDFRFAQISAPNRHVRGGMARVARDSPLAFAWAKLVDYFHPPDNPARDLSAPSNRDVSEKPFSKTQADRVAALLGPSSPPAKPVPIESLKLSPYVMDRLREENPEAFPKTGGLAGGSASPSARSAVSSLAQKSVSDGQKPQASDPWSYRPYLFLPGLTMSEKPIWPSPVDLSEIVPIIAGPPDYSLDTKVAAKGRLLSLGNGGVLVVEVTGGYVTDEDGPDFVIFGDQFVYKTPKGLASWAETAQVSVSEVDDPAAYRTFPCDSTSSPYRGCAGVSPVRYAPSMPITEVGGDLFDLSAVGLHRIRYIRIEDTGENPSFSEGTEGFDLDAVGLIHMDR
ncbi:MAG: hypothetical protein V1798_07035 [Pseudomonadota bacterium]